eukprot:COSAG02_NODE_18359_length_944_cov_0.849704_1_plen_69_part_01
MELPPQEQPEVAYFAPEPEPEVVDTVVPTLVTPVLFRRYRVEPGSTEAAPSGKLAVRLVHVASPEDGRF